MIHNLVKSISLKNGHEFEYLYSSDLTISAPWLAESWYDTTVARWVILDENIQILSSS